MIYNDKGKALAIFYIGKKRIASVYSIINKKARLLWQAVRSCFGSGIWRSNKPWIGNEKWKY